MTCLQLHQVNIEDSCDEETSCSKTDASIIVYSSMWQEKEQVKEQSAVQSETDDFYEALGRGGKEFQFRIVSERLYIIYSFFLTQTPLKKMLRIALERCLRGL